MPSVLCHLRNLPAAALALSLCSASMALAEERVRILFLPPPMEGTFSLGIYNQAGELVRVLHDEADTGEFHPAFNGLITHWDGKDQNGTPCPAGKYRARGYMVGELKAEGIDFHGNDWYVDDDSPRFSRITRIAGLEGGKLLLEAQKPGETAPSLFVATPASVKPSTSAENAADAEGEEDDEPQHWKAIPAPEGTTFPQIGLYEKADSPAFAKMKGVETAGASTIAPDGNVWGIDGNSVKEFTPAGEPDRELHSLNEELRPAQITATEPFLFVLVQSDAEQRLRGLLYDNPGKADVDMAIHFSDKLEQALPLLTFPDDTAFESAEILKAQLVSNPLLKDQKAGQLRLKVAATPEGTVLTTSDGLPLQRISSTPHLRWASAGQQKGKSSITLFESDGAVIAEYRISNPGNLMAFDAGTYKWRGEKSTAPLPTPEASSEGTPAATGEPATEAHSEAPQAASTEAAPSPAQVPAPTPTPEPTVTPAATPSPAAAASDDEA